MGMACLALKSSELWWSDYDDHDDATCTLILALAKWFGGFQFDWWFVCMYILPNFIFYSFFDWYKSWICKSLLIIRGPLVKMKSKILVHCFDPRPFFFEPPRINILIDKSTRGTTWNTGEETPISKTITHYLYIAQNSKRSMQCCIQT